MTAPLAARVPPPDRVNADSIFEAFLAYVDEKALTLYPAQEEALLEIVAGKNVILATPTGSGKSLVATALHFKAICEGRRSIYTCPIKALVSEKFFALCADFGAENVGMMTGDATVNRDAPILVCTAEILASMALREGDLARADAIVMDEFHYYADRDRGVAWQIPLLALPQATFLLMSATMGPTERFEEALTKINGKETVVVRSSERPVPLDFEYRETPLHETLKELVERERAPIYLVNFTQRAAAEVAQDLLSTDWLSKDEKRRITETIEGVRFDSPYGKEVQKLVKHGIGLHHAGLLPRYRLTVEKLAQKGLLKIVCGTDTLGVGVNVPIRTVLFTRLCKFDGEKTTILPVRDFQQISGRAGRKGFDDRGTVVAQAPEHVIENLEIDRKVAADPSKKKKLVRRKPPERGYVHWDRGTFDRVTTSPSEPLVSRFQVSHAMLLAMLSRPVGGCRAMKKLVADCHESQVQKHVIGKHAIAMFHSLVVAGIVELQRGGVRLHAELQEDFSLNQALALWLVDTVERLDRESPQYGVELLTLVESILEQPDVILMKQSDKAKSIAMAQMKAAGVEYDERIAKLEQIDYPRPDADVIYESFRLFAKAHPWIAGENVHPKSIAREMWETYQGFAEYVRSYELQRSEGLLLRYLTEVYKVLVQTVPEAVRTEEVEEMIDFFRSVVRGADSSLLEEWERMRDLQEGRAAIVEGRRIEEVHREAPDVTRDPRAFTAAIRNELFGFLRLVSEKDWAGAAAALGGERDATSMQEHFEPYFASHRLLRLDAQARGASHTKITRDEDAWAIEQLLLDAPVVAAERADGETEDDDGATGFAVQLRVDLSRARDAGRPILELVRVSG